MFEGLEKLAFTLPWQKKKPVYGPPAPKAKPTKNNGLFGTLKGLKAKGKGFNDNPKYNANGAEGTVANTTQKDQVSQIKKMYYND